MGLDALMSALMQNSTRFRHQVHNFYKTHPSVDVGVPVTFALKAVLYEGW